MDENTERQILLSEVMTLIEGLKQSSHASSIIEDVDLTTLTLTDLYDLRSRLTRLIRSIGGVTQK